MTVCDETSDTKVVRDVRMVTSSDEKENMLIRVAEQERNSQLANFLGISTVKETTWIAETLNEELKLGVRFKNRWDEGPCPFWRRYGYAVDQALGWVLGVVWCNGLFLRSWIEYGVRPYPYPSLSRMQRAPIINDLFITICWVVVAAEMIGEQRKALAYADISYHWPVLIEKLAGENLVIGIWRRQHVKCISRRQL